MSESQSAGGNHLKREQQMDCITLRPEVLHVRGQTEDFCYAAPDQNNMMHRHKDSMRTESEGVSVTATSTKVLLIVRHIHQINACASEKQQRPHFYK